MDIPWDIIVIISINGNVNVLKMGNAYNTREMRKMSTFKKILIKV